MATGINKSKVILLAVLSILICTANALAIENQAQWDAAFQQYFGSKDPILSITNANESFEFSWQAHYWLRAYVSMAQTYNASPYLDKAVKLIDFMMANRDAERYRQGTLNLSKQPYYSAPQYYLNHRTEAAPGWRGVISSTDRRIQTLDDGQITHAIMRFVDLVYTNQRFASYKPKAQEYLQRVEEIVKSHDSSFVLNRFSGLPGSYYYPDIDGSGLYSGAVPLNHNATMGVSLLLLDKVKGGVLEYRQKAQAILDYFKTHVRLTSKDAYDWDYHPQNPASDGDEDLNHAHLDLSFLILAYHRGLNLTAQDMLRLANTLTKTVYLGNGELTLTVDGTKPDANKNYSPVGFDWIDLAEFDPSILDIAKEVYTKHYANPTWSRPFLGWAEIQRWSAALVKPEPPSNLRFKF
jgi:hypothetical protein